MLWRCSNKFNFHKEQNCRSSRQTHRGRPGVVSVCHVAGWTWSVDPYRKLNQKEISFWDAFKKNLRLGSVWDYRRGYWKWLLVARDLEGLWNVGYMYLYPVWSGSMLKREGITRDTNVDVENWFVVVKNTILQKKKNINAGLFIRKLHIQIKGRTAEFSLPMHSTKATEKNLENLEEVWRKTPQKGNGKKSKYEF